jgi:hypothetical protein
MLRGTRAARSWFSGRHDAPFTPPVDVESTLVSSRAGHECAPALVIVMDAHANPLRVRDVNGHENESAHDHQHGADHFTILFQIDRRHFDIRSYSQSRPGSGLFADRVARANPSPPLATRAEAARLAGYRADARGWGTAKPRCKNRSARC